MKASATLHPSLSLQTYAKGEAASSPLQHKETLQHAELAVYSLIPPISLEIQERRVFSTAEC